MITYDADPYRIIRFVGEKKLNGAYEYTYEVTNGTITRMSYVLTAVRIELDEGTGWPWGDEYLSLCVLGGLARWKEEDKRAAEAQAKLN
jgi:hypothetical protein